MRHLSFSVAFAVIVGPVSGCHPDAPPAPAAAGTAPDDRLISQPAVLPAKRQKPAKPGVNPTGKRAPEDARKPQPDI